MKYDGRVILLVHKFRGFAVLILEKIGGQGVREGRNQSPSSSKVIIKTRKIRLPLSAKQRMQDNWPDLHQQRCS